MRIITTKESLASPLALVAGAADTRGIIPMLSMVLIKATDSGQLSLICSDTGLLAKAVTPVEVKQGGEVAVDVRKIGDLLRAMPEKQTIEIGIESEKNILLIKSGRSRFRLPTMSASDYPRMTPAKEERISITMAARRLSDMIAEVSPSMADNDVRYYLNGALFSLDKKGLWIVSTDGHRMTVSHEPISGADALVPRDVIVPRKSVMLAKKLLGLGGNVTLTLGEANVQFTFEDGNVLFTNSVDGKYPNWRSFIPVCTDRVALSAERLTTALAMLATAAPDGSEDKKHQLLRNKVDVRFTKTTTTLRRGDAGLCEIDCVSSSDTPQEVAFNIGYLINAVSVVRAADTDVVLAYGSATTAITMRSKDKEYPVAVVMLLRV